MHFVGTPRPPRRALHATTDLDDFAMITYRVDTERLRRRVSTPFVPDVFDFDDGTQGSLVSAVPFLDRDFFFGLLPFVKVSCGQINYRAYGSVDGVRGVWFFGTSLDHPFVVLPRVAWRMPWHRDRIRIDSDWDGPGPVTWRLAATGAWGTAAVDLVGTGAPLARLDGFASLDETIEVLTHPMCGWYQRTQGGVGHYTVWHPVLEPQVAEVRSARFAVFEDLGLVAPGAEPHSALLQRTVHFDVHTPPRRLR